MSLPYLPLFIDDYEAATAHLTMLEDGAYNRLLRLCWRSPGCKLPNDEAWIMRKLRATSDDERDAVRAVLSEFFTTGRGKIWSKRLLSEHVQKSVAHQRKSDAGKMGATAKALKKKETNPSNAKASLKQPEPEPEPEVAVTREALAETASEQDPTDRERFLDAMGVGPGGVSGPSAFIGGMSDMAEAAKWSEMGLTVSEQIGVIRDVCQRQRAKLPDWKPRGFGYFTQPMAEYLARKSAPVPMAGAAGVGSERDRKLAYLRKVAGK
ncbi:YdaU family protein [Pseudogemmobacter sonorensis]|uniref:YdaU family protein n=1 Tax=Pseudogemmobacter sonorensis TaxID=2989681 RepID=UPI00369AF102